MGTYGYPVGRLRGLQPALGVLLGPDTAGDLFVVCGFEGSDTLVTRAAADDLTAAREAIAESGPRSVTEHRMTRGEPL